MRKSELIRLLKTIPDDPMVVFTRSGETSYRHITGVMYLGERGGFIVVNPHEKPRKQIGVVYHQ